MKIVHQNFIYEAVGKVYTEEDIKEILHESGVGSLSQLHALLEAIEDKNKKMDEEDPNNTEDVPDLQPTPEEKEIEDKQQAAQKPQEAPVEPIAPEGGAEVPPIETEPVAAPEVPVEPEKPVEEPAPEIEPEVKKEEPKKHEEKKKITKEPVAIKEPPTIEPEKKLPKEDLKEEMWLRDKQLGTLYNNFVNFPHADHNLNNAGRIIGLEAPGLKNDSKYLQADITAFVQGNREKPYSTWIRLRRRRNTQNWSTKCGCEIRCDCRFFDWVAAHAAVEGKYLAGKRKTNSQYRDENGTIRTINYMLPYTEKGLNPQGAKIMCKHLALLTRSLINKGLIEEG